MMKKAILMCFIVRPAFKWQTFGSPLRFWNPLKSEEVPKSYFRGSKTISVGSEFRKALGTPWKEKLSISCKLQLFGKYIYIYIPLARLYI